MAMLPLIMVNIAIYIHMVNSIKQSMFNKIEAVRDQKVIEVNHWLDERITDIRTIAGSKEIGMLDKISLNKLGRSPAGTTTVSNVRDILNKYLEKYDDVHEIHIVSLSTKTIIVSTDKRSEGQNSSTDIHLTEKLQAGGVSISDTNYSNKLNKPGVTLSMPLFNSADSSNITGILVANIDLEATLRKVVFNLTGFGKTGEVFMVNKNVITLNDLMWYEKTPHMRKITSQPAVDAALGKTGIIETGDYRGEKALAAYTNIPLTGWGIVAKQDLSEAYSPIYKLRKWMLIIVIMTLFGVIINTFFVSRAISDPINKLHRGSEIIGSGDLDHKVGTVAQDEIGKLSRTFDLMIEKLKITTASRDELNKEIVKRKHLEKTILEIEEHERRRIGHDLHDNLGQQLTGISFKSKGLENSLRKKSIPEAEDAARISYLIEMSKTQVKSLSLGLAPLFEEDEYSLATAIVKLASNSEKLFGIPCDLQCSRFVQLNNKAALIHIYRIVQEAITNAARHAHPEKIEIRLSKKENIITITVRDDGMGFSMLNQTSGMGLEIMKYRADLINASIDIRPHETAGTIVECVFSDEKDSGTRNINEIHTPLHNT